MNKIQPKTEKAFSNPGHNKLHLTFPNGNRISTIWSYGSYSDNYDGDENGIEDYRTFMQSDTVEIMIIAVEASENLVKKIQKKYSFEGESVKGYLNIIEWLDIVSLLAKQS